MRFRMLYRHPAPPDRPLLLFLMLPTDRPGQRIHAARLSYPPRARKSEADRTVACFELAPGSGLELAFELEATPSFAGLPEGLAQGVRSLLESSVAHLEVSGPLSDDEDLLPGKAALALARAALTEATARGWRGELVLGHLLLKQPKPHAWCQLETPWGNVECDPWFYFTIQRSPDFWLAYGLAPEPEAYLTGHEGRRVAWGRAPVPVEALPCQEHGGEEGQRFYFWPDAVGAANGGFEPPLKRELRATETGAAAGLKGALDALRTVAFAALLLVALGLASPGGWPLLAYAGYAALLGPVQGRAWASLLARPASRVWALEPLLFHAAFLAVVGGWDTVLPQTLFVLTWIYQRVRYLWLERRVETRYPGQS